MFEIRTSGRAALAGLLLQLLTPTAQAQSAQANDNTPSWASETIVVTGVRKGYAVPDASSATRTDTPLIETPQSVQVITSTLIEEQDRRTLADALVNVSGVTPTKPEEALFAAPIVRGFPAEIYVNGLPLYGATETANDPTSLVGADRIEVVKGPTSTVYGGGVGSPLGGLINVETKRPQDEESGFVAYRTGSFGTQNPYADLNIPVTDKIDVRITGEYQSNDSWIDRVKGDRSSLQPSILFKLGPQTELLVQGQFDHRSNLEYSGLPAAQALAGQLDRYAFPGATTGQPRTTIDNHSATVEFRHRFDDDMNLTVTGRYYDSTTRDYGSFIYPEFYAPDPSTPTAYPILPIYLATGVQEETFDANLLKSFDVLGGRHEVLTGVDYDHTSFVSDLGFDGLPIGILDLARPTGSFSYGAAPAINAAAPGTTQTDRYETIAAYLQDQATYGRFHFTGSLRFTHLQFQEREQGTDQTYDHVSPRVGATVDLVTGVALYAGYATGFRGAFAFVGLEPPKPETSTNYEGGLKFALKNTGLSGTIAVFQQTRTNVATPDPSNPLYSIQSGEQRARGVETDLVWEPVPAFSLLANYAYTEAEVTKDNSIPIGDTLQRVPKNSGRVAARYRVLEGAVQGLSFGAGVTAFDRRELTLPNTVSAPGYAVVDAQASYDFGRYTVEVSGVNLAGSRAFDTYEYLSFPVVMPIQPRSAYVTLKARF